MVEVYIYPSPEKNLTKKQWEMNNRIQRCIGHERSYILNINITPKIMRSTYRRMNAQNIMGSNIEVLNRIGQGKSTKMIKKEKT